MFNILNKNKILIPDLNRLIVKYNYWPDTLIIKPGEINGYEIEEQDENIMSAETYHNLLELSLLTFIIIYCYHNKLLLLFYYNYQCLYDD